jgi:hypothetical protein
VISAYTECPIRGPTSIVIKIMRSITPKSLARKRLFMHPEIYLLMLIACQKVKGGIEEAPLYMFFS